MKVLIIDCQNYESNQKENSSFAINIRDDLLYHNIESKIIKLENFLLSPDNESNLIFSGSFIDIWKSNSVLEKLQKYFMDEIKKEQSRNIIGICFGAQMMAKAINTECLSRLPQANNFMHRLNLKELNIFNNNFAFLHQDYIKVTTKGLNILSQSEVFGEPYIQAFTLNDNKNFWGFQFHPELNKEKLKKICLEFHLKYNNLDSENLSSNNVLIQILNKSCY